MVGAITAVGGGTVRDVLLGKLPCFWMQEWEYIALCLVSCGVTLLGYEYLREHTPLFDKHDPDDGLVMWTADTLGIGAFCVIGAQNAIRTGAGMHPLICVICGMFTATFGGVTRDVLCARPPRILHSHAELYATTALAGATVYVATRAIGASTAVRVASGFGTAVGARYIASKWNIGLPHAPWYDPEDENSNKSNKPDMRIAVQND